MHCFKFRHLFAGPGITHFHRQPDFFARLKFSRRKGQVQRILLRIRHAQHQFHAAPGTIPRARGSHVGVHGANVVKRHICQLQSNLNRARLCQILVSHLRFGRHRGQLALARPAFAGVIDCQRNSRAGRIQGDVFQQRRGYVTALGIDERDRPHSIGGDRNFGLHIARCRCAFELRQRGSLGRSLPRRRGCGFVVTSTRCQQERRQYCPNLHGLFGS